MIPAIQLEDHFDPEDPALGRGVAIKRIRPGLERDRTFRARLRREAQLAALDERLQSRIGKIKLVRHRADEAGISEIRCLEDVVPLLLPHTAYKSYPENWLREGRWPMMTKWLGTISPHPIKPIDMTKVQDIDSWIKALDDVGHYIACSSGTPMVAATTAWIWASLSAVPCE